MHFYSNMNADISLRQHTSNPDKVYKSTISLFSRSGFRPRMIGIYLGDRHCRIGNTNGRLAAEDANLWDNDLFTHVTRNVGLSQNIICNGGYVYALYYGTPDLNRYLFFQRRTRNS
jgi:hypothetical protein